MFLRTLVLLWVLCRRGAAAENGTSTEPYGLRLVGGNGRCRGQLQVQRAGQDWTGVDPWTQVPLWFGNRVCAELDCGSALYTAWKTVTEREAVVTLNARVCDNTSLIHCFVFPSHLSDDCLELNCLDSVRLVGGRSLCSGSLQIRDQSLAPSWASVCEGALDHHGAEVLCRELGCEAPLLQGALSPLGQTFHCEGNESALMDCPRNQTRTGPETCPTLNLSCSEPLRLVGGASRCEGMVELKSRGQWRRMIPAGYVTLDRWDLESAAVVCGALDCGFAVSTEDRVFRMGALWGVSSDCVRNTSAVRDCHINDLAGVAGQHVACSELLNVPEVSVSEGVWAPRAEGSIWAPRAQEGDWASPREGGVWVQMGADFQVSCSVEPQYPGGSFQLLSPTLNLTLPAVNHSAHFLLTDTGPAHTGSYTCVYLLQVFNHSFSTNSSLHIRPGESDSQFLVRALVLLLLQLLNFIPYVYYRQVTRGHQRTHGAPEEERTDALVLL